MLDPGERELELMLREVDRMVDRALVQLGESELEQMPGLGAIQALARVGSGLGRVSSGLSRVSSLGRAAGSLGRATRAPPGQPPRRCGTPILEGRD